MVVVDDVLEVVGCTEVVVDDVLEVVGIIEVVVDEVLVVISDWIAASTLMRGTEPKGEEQRVLMLTPVLRSAARILVTLPAGIACLIKAHAPATWGVAIEVPLHDS